MFPDEFDLFSTYLYLFGNKHVKYKLRFFFLLDFPDGSCQLDPFSPKTFLIYYTDDMNYKFCSREKILW